MVRGALLTTVVVGTVFLSMPLASAADISIGGPSDNDSNAVISGGVHSVGAIQQAYNSNDCVREIFGSFGISQSDVANLPNTVVAGTVTKSGDVFVNGQSSPVARHAITGGHQDKSGSTPVRLHNRECKLFRRPPSVSFVPDSLPAFVSMANSQFQFAIIASCGNAVTAVAAPAPKKHAAPTAPTTAPTQPSAPAPTPTPTAPTPVAPAQTQTQSQSQQVTQSQEVTVQAPAPTPAPATTTTTEQAQTPAPTAPATAPAAAALPNTGPGDIVGLFVASGLAGFFGYRRFLLRKIGH